MSQQNHNRSYAIGLTVLSALGRLIPHAPNVTPLGGSCLFAGSRLGKYTAYLLPLIVMLVTDPIVGAAGGGHSGYTWGSPFIYASFMINVWLGRQLVRNVTPLRVGGTAFLCSLQFFLITNFAVWLRASDGVTRMYAANLSGLMACYASALPFWGRTLAGDLFYSGAIFGVYAFLARRAPQADAITA